MRIEPLRSVPAATPTPPVAAAAPSSQDSVELGAVSRELLGETPLTGCETLWKTPVEHREGPITLTPVRLEDGTVVVNGREGTYAFDLEGRPRWTVDLGDCSYRPPVDGPGDVVYLRGDDKVYALEATSAGARVLWQAEVSTSAAPVVGRDGALYVAGEDRRLHVLDPRDGAETSSMGWEHLRSDEPGLLADGRLVLQGYDGRRAVVDPDAPPSGLQRLWKGPAPRIERELQDQVLKPTGFGPDGTEYRMEGQVLRVFEPDGHTVRWSRDLGGDSVSAHVALREDGAVYALVGDRLTALSPEGRQLFEWRADGDLAWTLTFDDRGTAYLHGSGPNRKAYAVDAHGVQKWATELPGHAETARVGPRNTLLLSGPMSPFQVLDLETGRLLHRTEEGAAFGEQPFLATSDGRMIVATEDGDLLGLRLRTPDLVKERIASSGAGEAAPEIREGRSFVVIGGVQLPVRS